MNSETENGSIEVSSINVKNKQGENCAVVGYNILGGDRSK
jgi:hypothetical protein